MLRTLFFERLDSTQNFLKSYLIDNPQSIETPLVVCAHIQTHGRGTMGKRWLSPYGGLYTSFFFPRQRDPIPALGLVSILSGLAVKKTLIALLPDQQIKKKPQEELYMKWPNDIICDRFKVAGILSEVFFHPSSNISSLIVGIGVNTNSMRDTILLEDEVGLAFDSSYSLFPPTSLVSHFGVTIDSMAFISLFYSHFMNLYEFLLQEPFNDFLRLWKKESGFYNKKIKIFDRLKDKVIIGKAIGITQEGWLCVKDPNKCMHIVSIGDIQWLSS